VRPFTRKRTKKQQKYMLNKNTEGEKRIGVNFFHTHVTPFVEYLLHFIWLSTIYLPQVRYIESERHCKIVRYVGSELWCY
jgi:hypothetical protein